MFTNRSALIRFSKSALVLFAVAGSLTIAGAGTLSAQKVRVEDILAKHVESIGGTDTRGRVRNRMIVGSVAVTYVSQKNQSTEGRVVFASEKEKNYFGMKLNANDYTGESFKFDGKNSAVGYANVGTRSVLGNFVESNAWLLSDSLFGGTLVSSWALIAGAETKGKLSFDGVKKVNGKEAYVLAYSRKGGSDLDVNLFFDKETFQHIRTEYKRTSSAGIGTRPEQSSGFSETRYKLTEDFSDFRAENGLVLPHKYRIEYLVTGQRGTTELAWDHVLTNFLFNQNLDSATFSVAGK